MDSLDELMDRGTQPVAEPDTLDDAMDAYIGRQTGEVRAGATIALDSNPDEIARQKRIATSLGVPLAAVEADPAFATREQRMRSIEQATASSPALRQKFSDADFARLAGDNVENLSAIERTMRQFFGSYGENIGRKLHGTGESLNLLQRRATSGFADLFLPEPWGGGKATEESLAGPLAGNEVGKLGMDTMQYYRNNVMLPQGQRTFGDEVVGGLGQVLAQISTFPIDRGFSLYAEGVSIMSEKVANDPATKAEKDWAMLGGGAVTGLTEKWAIDKMLGPLAVPIKNAFGAAAARIGIAAMAEGSQEFYENLLHEGLRKRLTNESVELDPAQAGTEAEIGAVVGGVVRAITESALHIKTRMTKADQAENGAAFIEKLNQLAAADKLLQRDADSFESFVAAAAEDGPVDAVFIDGRMLMQSGMAPALAEMSPAVREQLDRAILTGGDIAIPVAEYATRIAPTDLAPKLLDHLKTEADGFTRAEAADFMENQAAELEAEVGRILADKQGDDTFKASQESVKTQILADMNQSGRFTEAKNEADAMAYSSYYAARAAQLGVTPEELYQRRRVNFVAQGMDGQRFDQEGKLVTDTPEFANWFGDSKVVDADGKPLVVFHGSGESIGAFDPSKSNTGAFFFTANPSYAASHAAQINGFEGGYLNPSYLALNNPKTITATDADFSVPGYEREQIAIAKADGHDGVIFQGSKNTFYAAFDSRQVKSYNNKGTFDPADPNILNQSGSSPAARYVQAWKTIASDDAIFQNPIPDAFDMELAAQEIDPGMSAVNDPLDLEEAQYLAKKWYVTMPDGTHAYVMENQQGEVWIDASRLEEGASGGSKLYLLVGSYAEGNGKTFIGDPAGLSDVALIRRTENMLSLALKFGRTGFMRPHEYQMNPDAKGSESAVMVRPIEWVEGDDANNIAELIRTSYANTVALVPGIKNVTYNFDKRAFEQDGREFTNADFAALAARGDTGGNEQNAGDPVGGSVRDEAGNDGTAAVRAPVGSATLKRTAVTNTMARAESAGRGGDLLAEIGRFVSRGLTDSGLAGTLYQPDGGTGNRGAFSPDSLTVAILKGADLSTVLHEGAHFFFENDIFLASELVQQANAMGWDMLKPGEKQILADVSALMKWHGIQGDIEEQLRTWHTMDFEGRRSHHERTAESFEKYLFDGKAPSIELAPYFQKFRAWFTSVYTSIKDFLDGNPAKGIMPHPEAGKLNDEIRSVFDRMLATNEQIQLAEQARSMMPLFSSPETSGMTPDEYAEIQAQHAEATATAVDELQAKGMRDLQWLKNARGKQVARLKRESKALRSEVEIEARREVMSQPVYQAWGFLTRKLGTDDKLPKARRTSDPDILDDTLDSMFTAIAKLGGIQKEQALSEWGIDPKSKPDARLFGKPVWRLNGGGLPLDEMAQALADHGYLEADEHGKLDLNEFFDKFSAELNDDPQYSTSFDYEQTAEARAGEISNPSGLMAGRLDLDSLSEMGLPDEVINAVKARRMTDKEGIHPDIVAEMPGIEMSSGDELVRTLAAAQSPKEAITELADRLMLERHGELSTPEAIELAADAAIHNDMRARMVTTEYNALAKALGATEQVGTDKNGRPIMRRILESAAKEYATQIVARLKIKDIRPSQYANAETRAAKASAKALRVASESTEAGAVKSATESLEEAKQRLKDALAADPVLDEDGNADTTEIDKAKRGVASQQGRLNSAEERYRIAQRGSLKVAAEEKRNQMINIYATRAAYDAQDEIARIIRHFKQIKNPGSQKAMRGEYLVQMNALLARFDLRDKSADDRVPLADWVAAESERLSAVVPSLPEWVLDERYAKPYKDMTVEELRGLNDAVRSLEHMARREQQMYKAVRNQTYQAEVASVLDELRVTNPDAFDESGPLEYRKDALPLAKEMRGRIKSKFDAEFINIENLLDSITSGNGRQVFESLFGRLSVAQDERTALMKELGGFLNQYTKSYSARERVEMTLAKRLVPNTRLYMTREQRIAVALFNGSTEGRQRLAEGNRYNEQQIQAIVDSLDEKDVALVKAMWAMSDEKIWPMLAAVNERTAGIAPPKVKSVPFRHSTLGELGGGYVPLVYDGDMDARAHDLNTNSSVQEMLGGTATQAATQRSASKARADVVKRPLDLSLRAMAFKINETVHDITHREAIADTYRLLQNKELANALRVIAGPDAYNSLLYHVREVAVKPRTPSGFMEKAFWYLRKNTLINMMGASFNTVAINVLGASPAIRRVGGARFMAAAGKLTGPGAAERYNAILEKSAHMRQRLSSFDRDMNEELSRLNPSSLMPSMQFWFAGLSVMDRAITMPTWLAAYEQGIAKFKNDESAAVDYADRVIRQTQGSGRAVDLAKIAGGVGPAGEFKRILTMFYNFFGAQLGSIRRGGAIASSEYKAGNRANAASILTLDVLAIIVIPATLEAIARGNCGDEPDAADYLYCAARSSILFTGGFFPILRDVLPYTWRQFDPDFQGGFGARLSPVENALETMARMPKSSVDAATGEATEGDEKTLVRGFGYLFGLPGFQAWRTLDGYRALSEGETDNPAVLLTGPPKD